MGGEDVLRFEIRSQLDLVMLVDRGIPAASLARLSSIGFAREEIASLGIQQRAQDQADITLSAEESDRLVRLLRVHSLAEDAMRNVDMANAWLRSPSEELNGKTPLECVRTEAGAQLVEMVLATISWAANV